MENINDICTKLGIEIPNDKKEAFNKAVNENYKTVAEFEKKIGKVEADRDNWKEKAEEAGVTLEKYKDIDPEAMTAEIEKYKKRTEELDAEYKQKIADRDFTDALKVAMDGYKFTSESAKESVLNKVKSQGLKLSEGKILGLGDYIDQLKESDPSAFVDEKKAALEQKKAKFTDSQNEGGEGTLTKSDIMAIKDREERRAAIAKNIGLFKKEG